MRGEHYGVSPFTPCTLGSSPHARGTLILMFGIRFMHGIIPACAGNTPSWISMAPGDGDHPRMRGEHQSAVWERRVG